MRSIILAAALALAPAAMAAPASLSPALAPIGFLVGTWANGAGKVADTGETSKGRSTITPEAAGAVLLRRDHTELFDAKGRPTGGFDQIMMIYPEGGALHADYSDGAHVIHYVEAKAVPGRSVIFTSAPQPGAPRFRLSYELTTPDDLAVAFAMAPPGQSDFHPIAVGALHRVK